MKKNRRLAIFVLLFGLIALELIAVLSFLQEDDHQMVSTSYVSSPTYSGGGSSSLTTPFNSVNPLLSHKPSVVATPQYNTPRFQPTVTTAWQVHRFSAHTVHNIGSGGGVGGGTFGSTTSGFADRGIQITSTSVSTLTLAPMALAARNLKDGMTADEGLRASSPRRTVIHDGDEGDYGDENLKPDYDLTDPYYTPVGDIPWLWMLLLCVLYAVVGWKTKYGEYKKVG